MAEPLKRQILKCTKARNLIHIILFKLILGFKRMFKIRTKKSLAVFAVALRVNRLLSEM